MVLGDKFCCFGLRGAAAFWLVGFGLVWVLRLISWFHLCGCGGKVVVRF